MQHEALLYATPDELIERCLPFANDGVTQGAAVLVVLPSPNLGGLQRALGPHAGEVQFADMRVVGRNPARILPIWQRFIDDRGTRGRPIRGIGEPVWKRRSPDELVECQLHEALLDVAFPSDTDVSIVCPYDVERLDPSAIAEARHSHPVVTQDGVATASPPHDPISVVARLRRGDLSAPPPDAISERFDRRSISHLRRVTEAVARGAAMADGRVDDLVIAVSEIGTNSVLHGGGGGVFTVWIDDETVVCQVRDAGRFDDPFAGRRAPTGVGYSGRGLWIVNQVCDLVQIRDLPDGSIVRLRQRTR